MDKQTAITLFGNTTKLAAALGISPQAVSMWPDGPLAIRREHEVIGAALKAGIPLPPITPAAAQEAA